MLRHSSASLTNSEMALGNGTSPCLYFLILADTCERMLVCEAREGRFTGGLFGEFSLKKIKQNISRDSTGCRMKDIKSTHVSSSKKLGRAC